MGGAVTWQLVEHDVGGDRRGGRRRRRLSEQHAAAFRDRPRRRGRRRGSIFGDTGVRLEVDRRRTYLYEDALRLRAGHRDQHALPSRVRAELRASFVGLPPRMLLQRLGVLDGHARWSIDPAGFEDKPIRLLTGGEDPAHTRAIEDRTLALLRGWGPSAELTWLPDLGIEGNGHFMFLEENSDELVDDPRRAAGRGRGTPAMTRYGSDVIVDLLIEAGIDHVAFNPGASFRGIHDSLVADARRARDRALPARGDRRRGRARLREGERQADGGAAARRRRAAERDRWRSTTRGATARRCCCSAGRGRSRRRRAGRGSTGSTPPTCRRSSSATTSSGTTSRTTSRRCRNRSPAGLASATSAPPGPSISATTPTCRSRRFPPGRRSRGSAATRCRRRRRQRRAQLELLAAALRRARRPAILAGYAGETPEALDALTRLAETIGAPVVDTGVRFAFPTDHPLAATGVDGVLEASDVVLTLDVDDLRGPFGDRLGNGSERGSVEVLAVGLSQLRLRGWSHDYQPLAPVSSLVTAAADETVAALLPLLETEPPDRDAVQARLGTTTEALRAARAEQRRTASRADAEGAIPLERLVHEVGVALRVETSCSGTGRTGGSSTRSGRCRSPSSTSAGTAGAASGTAWAPRSAPRSRVPGRSASTSSPTATCSTSRRHSGRRPTSGCRC